MRFTALVRSCALALSLFHLAMVVSLFIPSLGPASEDRLVPESLWQMLFAQDTPAPAIIAGFLFLPLLVPPLASWAACRSRVSAGSLLPLWSCLLLLLVGLLFWLLGPTNDPQRLVLRVGFALSFLLTLVETISLPLLLRSQEQAPRLVNQSETLLSAQDKPARRSDPWEGERRSEYTGTRRSLPSLVLPLILVLLCYLLIFLSLFFPYLDTSGSYESVSFQTTGWQLSGEWLACTGGLSVPLFLLTLSAIASLSFTPIQKHSMLFRSIALTHLFNLLGFLSSSLLLIFSLSFGGDLHGPFHHVDAAFGIPPAAFLLTSIGSGLLLSRVLELRSGTRLAPAPVFPP